MSRSSRVTPASEYPFSVVKIIKLDAVNGKKTTECFATPWCAYRYDGFRDWPSEYQSEAPACSITALTPATVLCSLDPSLFKGTLSELLGSFPSAFIIRFPSVLNSPIFPKWIASLLGISVDPLIKGSIEKLEKLFRKRGYAMTLEQSEEIMKRTLQGEDTGVLLDGRGNFFFVENGKEGVLILHVYRVVVQQYHFDGWLTNVCAFDEGVRWGCSRITGDYLYGDYVQWRSDSVIFVRNFDPTGVAK